MAMKDHEVICFIVDHYGKGGKSASSLLKFMRAKKLGACESSRFARLFNDYLKQAGLVMKQNTGEQ